jgi:HAD superfamily hydrolase (TIGR01484 family)
MKITNLAKLKPKKLIAFDMDGTITASKSPLDPEMASLLIQLLSRYKVAVVSGAKYEIFKQQIVGYLKAPKKILENLFLFPTTATSFYRYNGGWKNVYSLTLSSKEKNKVRKAFDTVFKEVGYKHPKKVYGTVIEDRGSQITFSALGQDVVATLGKRGLKMKEAWRQKYTPLKLEIAKRMAKYLPELEVRAAAFTSIDITKKGIDKAYSLEQMEKYLRVKVVDILFIGDAIFPGGNDYAVVKTKVDYVPVSGIEETKKIIRGLLK